MAAAAVEGPDARDVLDAMEAEHERIDPLLATCAEGFATMVGRGSAASRDALTVNVTALHDALSAHLAHEESDATRLVQDHLMSEDWERVDQEFFEAEYGPRDLVPVLDWMTVVIRGAGPSSSPRPRSGASR